MTPERNRPAKNPGGMECQSCGSIFIGEEWHELCGVCFKRVVDGLAGELRDAQTIGKLQEPGSVE